MSVDIHPTSQPACHPAVPWEDTSAPRAASQSGPVGRIIAGSLAVGAATALVLSLAVFAGGRSSFLVPMETMRPRPIITMSSDRGGTVLLSSHLLHDGVERFGGTTTGGGRSR